LYEDGSAIVCLNPVQHNLKDKNFLASKGRITPKIKTLRKKNNPPWDYAKLHGIEKKQAYS
jgi:hypothetical protein